MTGTLFRAIDAIGPPGSRPGDYPTTPGTWEPVDTHPDSVDGVITFLTMLPHGATKYGTSTPGTGGPIALGVLTQPAVGRHDFGITSSNAPQSSTGWLVFALAGLSDPLPLMGASACIDPTTIAAIWQPVSDDVGWSEVRVPIPGAPGLAGMQMFVQSFWRDPGAPCCLVASNALALEVQP